ncbi:FAD-dependent oxidoreductase [Paenibacillus dokdonensis]|uniref:FAD-dependent oxidoreductase n=1 Tax=Paenibacillus dokdonensis TaxID=2567944 RepID=A0ABU6GR07_9BACL|nr:FAD-dependent oxidoreductase [Paenibacillus dokdonensis]MEC0242165.1 FAD-dependent oxidoreductase [Paenibacillus dokdonensis]
MHQSKKMWQLMLIVMISALVIQFFIPRGLTRITQPVSCGEGCSRYDVVVVGSELQGVLLAREAQNLGLSVLILDPREKPGGELIQGEMLFLDEPFNKERKSLVQGEMKNLFHKYNKGKVRDIDEFTDYYNGLIENIPLKSGIKISKVNEAAAGESHMMQSLMYTDRDQKDYKLEAGYWVENTDFNALTGKLKHKKRIPGMEVVEKSNQPDYMGATYMLKYKNVDWRKLNKDVLSHYPLSNVQELYGPNTYVDWNFAVGFSNIMGKYTPAEKLLRLRGLNIANQGNGHVIINGLIMYNVDPSSDDSVNEALRKGRVEAPHILEYLRTHLAGFENAEMNGYPSYLYIRDFNRFETDYVLKYEDVMSGKMFWDNVSIGSYPVDLQGTVNIPHGISYGVPDSYGIPLRSFQLKEYDNVLVVGKNIGADIKAYGTSRIMPNNALAAQTIGVILGYESQKKQLKDLTPEDFKRIHHYLKRKYKIDVEHA